jgi:hypothetical protein
MVALARGAKSLGTGVASDDQIQAKKAEMMALVEGQMLHPDVLQSLKVERVDFAEWLTEARAQLDRSQQCISTLTSRVYDSCAASPEGSRNGLLQAFASLREQLNQDPANICEVMDDFCFFSSASHFKGSIPDPLSESDMPVGVGTDKLQPHSSDILTNVKNLREAISLALPYIERMKQFYEEDRAVYERANDPDLQRQDTEYLERAVKLHESLEERIKALITFADLAQRVVG